VRLVAPRERIGSPKNDVFRSNLRVGKPAKI
jgi:hypothetical protein